MKRVLHFAFCVVLLLAPAFARAGEVIDSVVASVNRGPILHSDWDEAVRFEAFMQQRPLSQVGEADRILALQHLIDRELLKAQMDREQYLAPSADAVQQDVAKIRAQVPHGQHDAAWKKLLAGYGLSEAVLERHLSTEVEVMNFVEVRLRPNVHIEEEEIENYYKNQLLPDLLKNGAEPIALESVKPRIRELLTQQRMDELLDAWLHNLRQQAEIHSSVAIPGINAPAKSETAVGAN